MEADEETSTRNEVQRSVELKEKKLSGLKSLKRGIRGWSPEIDLIHAVSGGVERKPVVIGDRDEDAHIGLTTKYTAFTSDKSKMARIKRARKQKRLIMGGVQQVNSDSECLQESST